MATKLGRNPLKLRENNEVVDLLEAREPGIEVSVLETRPAGRLTATMDEASYGPSHADPWPATLEYPEMTVRHYEGRPRQSRLDAPLRRQHDPARVLPMAIGRRNPSHPQMTFGDTLVRAARPTEPHRTSSAETSTSSTASSRATSGTSPPRCSAGCGAGNERNARFRGSRCSSTPSIAHGRGRLAGAPPLHRLRDPGVRPDLVGPTRAAAQRGGSLADVAQPRALLRTPGPPGHLGQDDHRTARGRRAMPATSGSSSPGVPA